MLSRKVKASVLGTLIERKVYSGYAQASGVSNKPAYIVSKKHINDELDGVVIAVATLSDGEEKLIVAPEGEIHYEPELRLILSKLNHVEVQSLRCLYEKSCGAIVFYRAKDNIKVLLVKNNNGRYWSFPKGHIELGEKEEETAVREIKEETDLTVKIIDGFREISDYCPFGKIRKRVVFFLAEAENDTVKIQESEIEDYIWVDLDKAKQQCNYTNDLKVIDKAKAFLEALH